jgi:type II secretory pathway component PulF
MAMSGFPDVFTNNTICMIKAGEKTGNLVAVVRNLIDFFEMKQSINRKFISGMAYPITVCVIGFIATPIFLFFIMLKLQKMLTSVGGELPTIAKCLIAASNFAFQYWWMMAVGRYLSSLVFLGIEVRTVGDITSRSDRSIFLLLEVLLRKTFIVRRRIYWRRC